MITLPQGSVLLLAIVMTSSQALTLFGKRRAEAVVRRYFDGVTKKDPVQIRSCFGDTATITDVTAGNERKTVDSQVLTERCMDFVTAHEDCVVDFHYGPQAASSGGSILSSSGTWVWAHWFEVGKWTGESCGLKPTGAPMACEGQTRFLVQDGKIKEFVVTRTMTEWETAFLAKQSAPK